MKIIVSAFEAFQEEKINPTEEVLKLLPNHLGAFEIIKIVLPVERTKCVELLYALLCETKADAVLCLGQAGGRKGISLERVAINLDDFRIPDNAGHQVIDEKIYAEGENAYFSTFPLKRMQKKLENEGVEAKISYTAGTFVCNHLFYSMLHLCQKNHLTTKVGFFHVPYCPEQISGKSEHVPFMALEDLQKALLLVLPEIFEEESSLFGGTLC